MKKYIFGIIALVIFNSGFGQPFNVKASLGVAGNPSNVRIYLRPTITATAVFSSLQFTIALPAAITPVPTLSIVSTAFAAAPAGSWIIDAPYVENGFIVYAIYTSAAGYSLPVTANTEFQAMEVSFSGGPVGTFANAAHLICLPDGGTLGGNAYFFCSGTLNSNGSDLFYARDAAVNIANGFSYRETDPRGTTNGPAGTFTSFARLISGISLPVKFASFFLSKQNNDGLLNWNVENQSYDVKHFEVERSFNGVSFTKIKTQNPIAPTNGFASYVYTDAGVFDTYKGTVYYRVKEVDLYGAITYSPVRSIKADSKAFAINVYPNPVKDKANIVFTLDKAEAVTVSLMDVLGNRITDYSIQAQKGFNQKQIDMSSIAAGTYNFRTTTKNDVQNISFVKSN